MEPVAWFTFFFDDKVSTSADKQTVEDGIKRALSSQIGEPAYITNRGKYVSTEVRKNIKKPSNEIMSQLSIEVSRFLTELHLVKITSEGRDENRRTVYNISYTVPEDLPKHEPQAPPPDTIPEIDEPRQVPEEYLPIQPPIEPPIQKEEPQATQADTEIIKLINDIVSETSPEVRQETPPILEEIPTLPDIDTIPKIDEPRQITEPSIQPPEVPEPQIPEQIEEPIIQVPEQLPEPEAPQQPEIPQQPEEFQNEANDIRIMVIEFSAAKWTSDDERVLTRDVAILWERAAKDYQLRKLYRIRGSNSAYKIEFASTGREFDRHSLLNFSKTLSLVDLQIYNKLSSIYYNGATVFGPSHRFQCAATHAPLPVDDEICMNDKELDIVILNMFPYSVLPRTREGKAELIATRFGNDQADWPNNIMLEFYKILWKITQGDQPFTYTSLSDVKDFLYKKKIITSMSKEWPVMIESTYPNWKNFTQDLFGNASIFKIHEIYLATSALVLQTLKPRLIKPSGWLEDTEISHALESYASNPDYKFKFWVLRIPFGEAAGSEEFDPLSPMWFTKPIGSTKFAFILNTSPEHDGSHWVLFFVDIEANTGEYMDSMSNKPNSTVQKYIKHAISLVHSWFPEFNINYNDVNMFKKQKQMQGTECGVYAVHYTIQRLLGVSLQELDNAPLPDASCNKLRKVYWLDPVSIQKQETQFKNEEQRSVPPSSNKPSQQKKGEQVSRKYQYEPVVTKAAMNRLLTNIKTEIGEFTKEYFKKSGLSVSESGRANFYQWDQYTPSNEDEFEILVVSINSLLQDHISAVFKSNLEDGSLAMAVYGLDLKSKGKIQAYARANDFTTFMFS